MARRGRKRKRDDSLCWECRNAVPNIEKLQGCSWSIFFIPVKGWDADPTIVKNGLREDGVVIPPARSYYVKDCPYFEKG